MTEQTSTLYFRAKLVALTIFMGVLSGCGASSPFYADDADRPGSQPDTVENNEATFSLFLIGDTGAPGTDPLEPNLQALQHHLNAASEQSAVVFLGDNIYSDGLLPQDHPERAESERRIDAQIQMLENFQGRVIFIPGNHDWNSDEPGGWEAIKRQQTYIEDRLGDGTFLPKDGCPGPVEVRLDSSNTLLVLDTQWWLYPHDKPGLENCPFGSKDRFIAGVDSLLKHNTTKNLFVTGHHPFYSNGTHNGFFPFSEHLFPLLDYSPYLYLPLPIYGSITPWYRKYVGYRQDLAGNEYRQLRSRLTDVFSQYPNLVYATGHDHNLQHHQIGDQHYVISGAGTVERYARKGRSASFAYTHKGFARIDISERDVQLTFWTPEGESEHGRLVYETILYEY